MASYRIYRVGPGERLHPRETLSARDDAEAVELAKAARSADEAIELWEGGRLVGRLSKAGDFTAA